MLNQCFSFLTILLLTISCSTTSNLSLSQDRDYEYKVFNNSAKNKYGNIKLFTGETLYEKEIYLSEDRLRITSVNSDSIKYLNIKSVKNISFKNHLSGAFQGFMFGFFSTGLIGMLMSIGSEWQGYAFIVTGTFGAIVGSTVGLIKGNEIKYKFVSLNNKRISAPHPIYPDTIFIKRGKSYPCYITDLNETLIKIKSGLNLSQTSSSIERIERIVLDRNGTIYQSNGGFKLDINSIKAFLKKRIR